MAPQITTISQRICEKACCKDLGFNDHEALLDLWARAFAAGTMEDAVVNRGKGKRMEKRKAESPTEDQAIALQTVIGKDRPPTDLWARRRRYELNLYFLFRLYSHKRRHGLIPPEMDDKTGSSYNQLVGYLASLRSAAKYEAFFHVGKEECLTELAAYWRGLAYRDEMMKYRAIWEHVAQRRLACEGLAVAEWAEETPLDDLKSPLLQLWRTGLNITMTAKMLPIALRTFSRAAAQPKQLSRSFRSSPQLPQTVVAGGPVRKPVGAFRGGMFGFLLGTTLAGAGTYYYVLDEYRVSNELLTEDIYALQAAVQRLHTYVSSLEEKMDAMQKKK
ncbi:MAG: hypothetical protein LQ345_004017 [Seirophora villosa]|nr:MAG: hypothetical protein LQ345_004017 [Seirophora villosa]